MGDQIPGQRSISGKPPIGVVELNRPNDSASCATGAMTEESHEFLRIPADRRGAQVTYWQTLARSPPGLGRK